MKYNIKKMKILFKDRKFEESTSISLSLLQDKNQLSDQQRFDTLYNLGHAFKMLGKTEQAVSVFEEIDRTFIKKYQGLEGLFQVYTKEKQWGKVIETGNKAKQRFPNIYKSYYWKGTGYLNLKDFGQAEKEFSSIIEKFPGEFHGIEGLTKVFSRQKNWVKSAKYARFLINEHPNVWTGYWHLGIALKNINNYDEAISIFKILHNKFPTRYQGLQGQIVVANDLRKWELVIELSEKFIKDYPQVWQGYLWKGDAHKNIRQYDQAKKYYHYLIETFPNIPQGWDSVYKVYLITDTFEKALEYYSKKIKIFNEDEAELFNYFKVLQDKELEEQALEAIDKIFKVDNKSPYGFWARSIYKSNKQDFQSAYSDFKSAIKNCETNKNLYRDVILNSKELLYKLKLKAEYIDLLNILKDMFPTDNTVITSWAEMPLHEEPLSIAWKKIARRYESILSDYNDDTVLLRNYVEKLLSCDELDKAEFIIKTVLKKQPSNKIFMKYFCLVSAYRKDAQQFESRYGAFTKKYKHDSQLFFHHINSLIKLNKENDIFNDYNDFNRVRYGEELNIIDLNNLQVNILLKRPLNNLENIKRNILSNKPNFNFDKKLDNFNYTQTEVIINNKDNQVIILCFSGLSEPIRKQFNLNGIQDTKNLDMHWEKKHLEFKGLAKTTPQFNFILVKNIVDGFHQKNFDENLELIRDLLSRVNYGYLVTMGGSAGAFSSILFGQYLHADTTFAFSPRTQAYMFPPHPYYRAFQLRYHLYNPETIDLGYMQKANGGFKCKTYVILCENDPCDFLSVNTLNHLDPNLHISYFYGDIHQAIKYVGKKYIFEDVIKTIEKELYSDFNLNINRDIFIHLKDFKYNSYSQPTIKDR